MSNNDNWYRSPDWSQQDQDLFYAKIQRCRGNSSRSQCAKIKALSLIETGKLQKIDAAIELLQKSLQAWPSEFEMDTDASHSVLGDAFRLKKDYQQAATHYEASLTWGHSRETSYWEYPKMIVTQELKDLYDRALEIVNKNAEQELVMEFEKYTYHAVRACVFEEKGDHINAHMEANAALAAASVKKSAFRYHPLVGLVKHKNSDLVHKLTTIAKS